MCFATSLAADPWFQHTFGEQRAYFGDWLAVCSDNGAGPCRVVQTLAPERDGVAFDQRIAVHRLEADDAWAIEVMSRGMDADLVTSLSFMFDGEAVLLDAEHWKIGDPYFPNVAETLTVIDLDMTGQLINRMRADDRLDVTYAPASEGVGTVRYSLRGITAATQAINALMSARNQGAPG